MSSPVPLKVAIGIPTFRRPERLSRLLDALPHRIAELPGDFEVEVVVVDNDPAGTAREVVAASPLKARYEIEATPGIAAARNRILDSARGARLLAFIDDDTTPMEGWLAELVATWQATGAVAVMGWVISLFPPDTDPWVLASGVLQRPARPTGTVLAAAATASLLLDLEVTERLGLRFDASLGLSGGEDTLFTRRLVAAGGKLVWCNESMAQDEVPLSGSPGRGRFVARSMAEMSQWTSICGSPVAGENARQSGYGVQSEESPASGSAYCALCGGS